MRPRSGRGPQAAVEVEVEVAVAAAAEVEAAAAAGGTLISFSSADVYR
jgi:hypothetical protein